eukprot:jgi/Mesvir1/5548/Mv15579-RA.1
MSVSLLEGDDHMRAETLKAISDGLQCSICQDPCMHDKCEQLWCRACIAPWLARESSCPTCRGLLHPGILRPAHRIIRQQLEVLPVPCPHRDDGCPLMLTRAALAAHSETCPKAVVPCPNAGCQVAPMPRERLGEHAGGCEFRAVECDKCGARVRAAFLEIHAKRVCPEETVPCAHNGGCEQRLKRKAMDEHVGTACKRATVICPIAGCADQVLRGVLDDHLASSVQAHLASLSREVTSLHAELARQREDHRRELLQLKADMTTLRGRLDQQRHQQQQQQHGRVSPSRVTVGPRTGGPAQAGPSGVRPTARRSIGTARRLVPAPTPRRSTPPWHMHLEAGRWSGDDSEEGMPYLGNTRGLDRYFSRYRRAVSSRLTESDDDEEEEGEQGLEVDVTPERQEAEEDGLDVSEEDSSSSTSESSDEDSDEEDEEEEEDG